MSALVLATLCWADPSFRVDRTPVQYWEISHYEVQLVIHGDEYPTFFWPFNCAMMATADEGETNCAYLKTVLYDGSISKAKGVCLGHTPEVNW